MRDEHQGLRVANFRITVFALVVAIVAGVPASAQLNEPLHRDGWILAAARAPGLHGSIWRTDLWVVADGADQSISFEFCEAGKDGRNAEAHVFTMTNGDRVAYIEDVVGHFLGVGSSSWVGAIHYTSPVAVQVWARVYSIDAEGTASYGQLVEGQPTASASTYNGTWDSNDHQFLYPIKHTADGRYRVNIGILNPTAVATEYWVALNDSSNERREGIWVVVPPMSLVQLTDPFADVDGGEWSDYLVWISCSSEGCGSFGYASVVDNATNDAYFVPGIQNHPNFDHPQGNCALHTDGWILAAARAPGMHGSIWRTDLWVAAPEYTSPASLDLSFVRSGDDGRNAQVYTIELDESVHSTYFEDVIEHFLGVGGSWVGAIHYVAHGRPVQVWARIYSVDAAGTASYGQLVQGIPTVDMSPDDDPWDYDEQQHVFAVKHTPDDRYRVNIGVVNPTDIEADYTIVAYGADLNCPPSNCGHAYVTVPPDSMVQLSDPFSDWQGGEWNAANLVVKCGTDGAGGFAYASVVDNATNDAFFVRAIKFMEAGR